MLSQRCVMGTGYREIVSPEDGLMNMGSLILSIASDSAIDRFIYLWTEVLLSLSLTGT